MTRPEPDSGFSGDEIDRLLRRAIDLAAQARAGGDPPFGSLIVDFTGTVLATARNTTVTENDITAHPELTLARWTAREYGQDPARLTMFTSCQPCPMCTNGIARARIGRVIYGLSSVQLNSLKPAGLPAPDGAAVVYDGPRLLDEARTPVEGYHSP